MVDPGLAGRLMAPLMPATGDAAEGGAPQLKLGCEEEEDMSKEKRSLSLAGCWGAAGAVGCVIGPLSPRERPASASRPDDEGLADGGEGAEEVEATGSAPKSSKSMRLGWAAAVLAGGGGA